MLWVIMNILKDVYKRQVYGSHNLNFKLDNELDKQAISKKDLR